VLAVLIDWLGEVRDIYNSCGVLKMKITEKRLRQVIKEELAKLTEARPTFDLLPGDSVRHLDEPEFGIGRVVAKGSKRGEVVVVVWPRRGTRRHHPSSLRRVRD
jgi:hypothetical protein